MDIDRVLFAFGGLVRVGRAVEISLLTVIRCLLLLDLGLLRVVGDDEECPKRSSNELAEAAVEAPRPMALMAACFAARVNIVETLKLQKKMYSVGTESSLQDVSLRSCSSQEPTIS